MASGAKTLVVLAGDRKDITENSEMRKPAVHMGSFDRSEAGSIAKRFRAWSLDSEDLGLNPFQHSLAV